MTAHRTMAVGRVHSLHRYPVKSMAGESLEGSNVLHNGLLGDRAFALRDDVAGELRSGRRWPRLMQCSARYRAEPTHARLPAAEITLPDGSQTSTDDPEVSRRLSTWLGLPATLCPLRPAEDKKHYRRLNPGASLGGLLARSNLLRGVVARLATLGANGHELRSDFAREPGEPLPDFSIFPAEVFKYVSPLGTYFDAFPIHLITSASLAALRSKHPGGDWDARRFRANFVIETSAELTGFPELSWAGRTLRLGPVELECVVPAPRCGMITQAQPGLAKDPTVLRTIVRDAQQNLGMYARVRKEGRVSVGDVVELL